MGDHSEQVVFFKNRFCLTGCLYELRHCYFIEQDESYTYSVPLHMKSDGLQQLAWIWSLFIVSKFCLRFLLVCH